MTNVVEEVNADFRFNEALHAGRIKLNFVVRFKNSTDLRSLICGFHLADDPQGWMVACTELEILRFAKFQQRCLLSAKMLIDHPAARETSATRKKWHDEIILAAKNGEQVDIGNCAYRMIGGFH